MRNSRELRPSHFADKQLLVALSSVPALAMVAMPAMAQDKGATADRPPSSDVEEVLVSGSRLKTNSTATKTPMTIRETPQAISVITDESIQARFAQDTLSAVELSSGVSPGAVAPGAFAGRGFRGDRFAMRGQQGSVRSDGFAFGGSLSSFDPAVFERIEVVKGPAGFYGQGSLGGFINLVRKKPKQEFAASVSAQAGSFDTYRADVDVTGPMNDSRRIIGRLNAGYNDAGSFVDGVETQTRLIAPSIEAKIGERTRVLLQLWSQGSDYIPNPGIPTRLRGDRIEPAHVPRSFFFGVPSKEKSTEEILDGIVQVDHNLSDRWLASLLFQRGRDDTKLIFDNYGFDFGAGDAYMYANTQQVKQDRWAGELRLAGSFDAFGREHQLLLGVERNRLEDDYQGRYTYLGPASLYAGNFADAGVGTADNLKPYANAVTVTSSKAVYAQTVLSVAERTRLLISARYDWVDSDRDDRFRSTRSAESSHALTRRIGLSRDFTDNLTGYVVWAQSFTPVSGMSRSGGLLKPETGNGYEAGLKTEWLDGQLDATLSVYQQDLTNRPLSDPNNGPGQNFSISAGLHRTRGIEAEINGAPMPGLALGLAATWMTNEFLDRRDPNFGLSTDDSIGHQFSANASYELQSGALQGLRFGATLVSYGDRAYIGRRGIGQVYADGYERLDLSIGYNGFRNVELSLHVRNVLDETYLERASGTLIFNNFYGAPRAVLARVKYRM